MKPRLFCIKATCILLSAAVLLPGCASTTQVRSIPSGAKVFVSGALVGTTPYAYTDCKVVGEATQITLKLEGYEDLDVVLVRNERPHAGAIVGGVLVALPLLLWCMQYLPVHEYELVPSQAAPESQPGVSQGAVVEELALLKGLLDQGAITKDDFTTLKVAVLDGSAKGGVAARIASLRELQRLGLLTDEEYVTEKAKAVEVGTGR